MLRLLNSSLILESAGSCVRIDLIDTPHRYSTELILGEANGQNNRHQSTEGSSVEQLGPDDIVNFLAVEVGSIHGFNVSATCVK